MVFGLKFWYNKNRIIARKIKPTQTAMPDETQNLLTLRQMIERAEAALQMAKAMLEKWESGQMPQGAGARVASSDHLNNWGDMAGLTSRIENGQQIVEGDFDGQNMIGPNEKAYPVPANYASKSKLVPGDRLKLTITPEGSFLYKQIGPIERKRLKGQLTTVDGQYKVICEGKTYNVLLASVTYFKANTGDDLTIIVPTTSDSAWAAIENVIPLA